MAQTNHVVQNRGDRGVAPQTHLLHNDMSYPDGMVEHRATVITHLVAESFGGVAERVIHQCGGLLREEFAHLLAQFIVTS